MFSQWLTTGNSISLGDLLSSTDSEDPVRITNNGRLRLNTTGGLEQRFGCFATGANARVFCDGTIASGLRGFDANYQPAASDDNLVAFNYQTTTGAISRSPPTE
jgi:hypothetical protein